MNIPPEGAKHKEIEVCKATGKKSSSDQGMLPSQDILRGWEMLQCDNQEDVRRKSYVCGRCVCG